MRRRPREDDNPLHTGRPVAMRTYDDRPISTSWAGVSHHGYHRRDQRNISSRARENVGNGFYCVSVTSAAHLLVCECGSGLLNVRLLFFNTVWLLRVWPRPPRPRINTSTGHPYERLVNKRQSSFIITRSSSASTSSSASSPHCRTCCSNSRHGEYQKHYST